MTSRTLDLQFLSIATKITVAVLGLGLVTTRLAQIESMIPESKLIVVQSAFFLSLLVPSFWIGLLAPVSYLTALWFAGVVFDRLSKGDDFGPTAVKGMREIGTNLMFGALAAILIAPTLTQWVEGEHGGFKYHYSIESITIGVIGLVMWFIAGAGKRLYEELDQIV